MHPEGDTKLPENFIITYYISFFCRHFVRSFIICRPRASSPDLLDRCIYSFSEKLPESATINMPKEKGDHAKSGVAHMKHVPLDEHIQKTKLTAEGLLKKVDRRKLAAERRDAEDDGLNAKAEFLDAKTSKKIMQQAQEQRDEESRAEMSTSAASEMHAGGGKLGAGGIGMGLLAAGESESEEEGEEEFEDEEYEVSSMTTYFFSI